MPMESQSSHTTAESEPPLIRKLKKVLDTRLENDLELVESLKAVRIFQNFLEVFDREQHFCTHLNLYVRRLIYWYLSDFREAFRLWCSNDLEELYDAVSAMNSSCKDMSVRLQEAKSQTEHLLRETSRIQRESEEYEIRSRVAEVVLELFQLTPEQEQQLTDKASPVTEDFFKALERSKQIHSDCKLLLMAQNQRAGLEVMEQMSVLMECGCEKLYRWIQNECRMQAGESAESPSDDRSDDSSLSDRPVLFKYALDEYANARRAALVKAFIEALTRGGSGGGGPRPMELHSHDPQRYVGDMLAWLHQATASETESLDSLLKLSTDIASSRSSRRQLRAACLCSLSEGVCRPLRLRVEQALVGVQDASVLYRLHNLLRFHQGTLDRVLGSNSSLATTVGDLGQLCWRLFFGALTNGAQRALETVEPLATYASGTAAGAGAGIDDWDRLRAPPAVAETLRLLQQVLTAQDSGMAPLSQRRDDLRQVLDTCIDPLLKLCTVTATRLSPLELAIFMANSLHSLQTGLAAYEFTETHIERLQAQLEPQLDALVAEQLSHILVSLRMLELYQTVEQHQQQHQQQPLSYLEAPCLSLSAVKAAAARFDSYLANPDSLALPQLQALQSSKLRQLVIRRVADQIHSVYTAIYDAIVKPENLFGKEFATVLVRNPDQVAKLIL
uniref:Conserved oligomeric Golgi complex subunit 6 n=1 Tax=Macrostomum lignano TaxID=282301 RepID=A0A1I8HLE4_9PLAT